MRKRPVFAFCVLACLSAGLAGGQERTESIVDPKDPGSGRVVKDLVYRDGRLAEAISYGADGALLKETFFDSSSLPVRTRDYIRRDGRLERVQYEDADGASGGSLSYRYDREGRLLGVDSEGDLGAGSAGLISSAAMPEASWVSGESTTVLGYDDSARAATIQTMKDGAVVSVERRSYGENGILASVRTEDEATGAATELSYDAHGRIALRTQETAKGQKSRTEYRYDDSGKLVQELFVGGGHRSTRTLFYAADGRLSKEETRRDGELVLVVEHIENGRVDELYDGGRLFVKATFIGGRKVKDEFYADGVLSRTKEYR